MPKQISKTLSVTLFNDEVKAWEMLGVILGKRREAQPGQPNFKKPTQGFIFRELLRIAATQLADEIGSELVKKLAEPPPVANFLADREARKIQTQAAREAAKKKAAVKKAALPKTPKPTQRVVWNLPTGGYRRKKSLPGVTE